MVSARANSADDLFGFGRGEDEFDVLRRFFHQFEQRVEALRGDHVGFVENEHLVAVASRRVDSAFTQVTRIVNTGVRSGVDFHDVQ